MENKNNKNDLFQGFGIKITLDHEDDFLKIKETLTRIGIASRKDKTLYQSCHILHKRGEYVIIHFKELFALDGKFSDLSQTDLARRNTIALLLEEWKLAKIVKGQNLDDLAPMNTIKVISHSEKKNWTLAPKYTIGT